MKLPDGWYDGEIIIHDENGKPNFNLLQLAFDTARTARRSSTSCSTRPGSEGLRPARRTARRAPRPCCSEVLAERPSDNVRFSAEFGTDPRQLSSACQIGLEGVIGKRRDSPIREPALAATGSN
jgi:bifunctional non-homologous end joining protein LigD